MKFKLFEKIKNKEIIITEDDNNLEMKTARIIFAGVLFLLLLMMIGTYYAAGILHKAI